MKHTLRRPFRLLLLIAACSLVTTSLTMGDEPAVLSRILFGSCIKQEQPMPILETIVAERPELFIFLGDNIYADTTDMEVMRAKYAKLRADAGFAKLLKACPVLATWDDHDYGVNDGGADYPAKIESQQLFVDFWNDPPDSPRRSREGVYDASMFGPAGKRVQVILLDTRYFRSPLVTGDQQVGGRYVPAADPGLTMLGEAQWQWLDEQLRLPADLRIIVTSIQFLPSASGQETWANLPLERERLLRLIASTKANGVVLISGDRHWSELSVLETDVPYPLYELTSSSLNQLHPRGTPTKNTLRALPNTFHRENYGVVEIDWSAADPSITLEIRDIDKAARLRKSVRLGQLQSAIRN
ncbi:MAG: alkaline phosphatase family protein [Planctomycetaceae bacterium]|nr:alkaline phosphatase family protein [Planctomycetales bacterium]MCB9875665.1 alkaline phosphatase family protein [Planctomycetaceae bacterium]HRX83053.1 alkaline phosphatase D family protein [Pirellulaceae bacterium]